MAACGSIQHIFDNPLPENSTLLESLSSWNKINPVKPIDQQPSFTEIFGELHFKENPHSHSSLHSSSMSSSSSSSSSCWSGLNLQNGDELVHNDENKSPLSDSFLITPKSTYNCSHRKSESFSSMNSESLQLCTEGLGFESSGDVEDLKNDQEWEKSDQKTSVLKHSTLENNNPISEFRRSRSCGRAFPPPISCIGKSGKPWVCFKSYRQDGRFVLKEIRIPTQEFLHAYREDGRLKLQFVQPNDEILEEDESEEDGDDDEEDKNTEICNHNDNEKNDNNCNR